MIRRRPLLLGVAAFAVAAGSAIGITAAASGAGCLADPADDVRVETNPDLPAADDAPKTGASDLREICVTGDGAVEVSFAVASPVDPTTDAGWQSSVTAAVLGFDADGDGVGDRFLVYGVDETGALSATVTDPTGTEICASEARFGSERYRTQLTGGCAGEVRGRPVQATLVYDMDPADPLSPVLVDVAPDGGGAVPGASLPAVTRRLAGHDRIETAVAIARAAFPEGAGTAYLARAGVLADAAAGGVLTDGPILLVPRCGDLPTAVAREIARLDPDRVVALGGDAAVCDALLARASQGRTPGRLSGPDRYATSVAISQHAFPVGASEVYLARGDVLADAVTGGVLKQGPVLLVPRCGELPEAVAAEIYRLVPNRIYALGGKAAVCDELIAAAVEATESAQPGRLAGADRIGTSIAIAEHAFRGGAPLAYIARADVFADAVVGGVLRGGPILLVNQCGGLPDAVVDALAALDPDEVVALGGTGAVCDRILDEAGTAG